MDARRNYGLNLDARKPEPFPGFRCRDSFPDNKFLQGGM